MKEAGTKLYIQLFCIDRKSWADKVRCVVLLCVRILRKPFLQHFYDACFLRLPGPARLPMVSERMKITFQFLSAIDEASKHSDFYGDLSDCIVHSRRCHPWGWTDAKASRTVINSFATITFIRLALHTYYSRGSIMKIGINCFASDGIQALHIWLLLRLERGNEDNPMPQI